MGRGEIHRVLARVAAAGLAGLTLGAAGAAHAAFSDRLCSPYGAGELKAYPSADALQSAAASLETALRRRGAADPFRGASAELDPPAAAGQRPSPAAVAEYCAAAGELMRVSQQGSQLQAQYYLLSAFQAARQAGLTDTASTAAYRLGLVTLTGPAAQGVRGARGPSRGGTAAAIRGADTVTHSDDPCEVLASGSVFANTNLTLSLAALGCSAQQAGLAGDSRTGALADLRLARLALAVADANSGVADDFHAKAWAAAAAGLAMARGIDNPGLRAEVLGRLASAALDARPVPTPEVQAAVAGIEAAAPDDPSAQAFATALKARLAFAAGDAPQARALMDQALIYESEKPLPERLPQWRLLLADMDPEHREAHVLAAYDALDAIRPLLPRFDPLTEEPAFSLYMRKVFQAAVDVRLASATGAMEPIRVRDAQQIIEAYRQAELQSVFGSECIPARNPLRPESLAAGEVLLYPILLPDRLELLYVSGGRGGGVFHRLPPNYAANRQSVSRLVETAVLSLSYDEDENWRPASHQLYDLLIKPIEGQLSPGSVLVVVPDGALRALPFGVLLDADNKYLIQKTRITVAPSLAYSQPGSSVEKEGEQLVAAALEKEVRLPAGDFEKLTGTGAEAKVAAVTDGKRIEKSWVIENFKKADLVRALTDEKVDILHLATHASFNGRSDRAFIVADGEVILLSELRQILQQNRTRGDELDLLVLSACETAVGDDEASMGLAGAAVQAGARSAIASLWPVNDVGTSELMKDFYQRYREGKSKSEALREAQVALIDKGGMYADPNVWAAFTLLGAWR